MFFLLVMCCYSYASWISLRISVICISFLVLQIPFFYVFNYILSWSSAFLYLCSSVCSSCYNFSRPTFVQFMWDALYRCFLYSDIVIKDICITWLLRFNKMWLQTLQQSCNTQISFLLFCLLAKFLNPFVFDF